MLGQYFMENFYVPNFHLSVENLKFENFMVAGRCLILTSVTD